MSNPFGLPFKVIVRNGRKQSINYKQDKMCFDYTKPRLTLRTHSDPVGNQAVRNLMKGQNVLPWTTHVYPQGVFKARRGEKPDYNSRGYMKAVKL